MGFRGSEAEKFMLDIRENLVQNSQVLGQVGPREAVQSPSLGSLKTHVNKAPSSLV